jgi:metal-dependent amidase/aminoacylase/carboxypeptidase family protein
VTYNDPNLTEKMLPTLRAVRKDNAYSSSDGAEDFSFYQDKSGIVFLLGGAPKENQY